MDSFAEIEKLSVQLANSSTYISCSEFVVRLVTESYPTATPSTISNLYNIIDNPDDTIWHNTVVSLKICSNNIVRKMYELLKYNFQTDNNNGEPLYGISIEDFEDLLTKADCNNLHALYKHMNSAYYSYNNYIDLLKQRTINKSQHNKSFNLLVNQINSLSLNSKH